VATFTRYARSHWNALCSTQRKVLADRALRPREIIWGASSSFCLVRRKPNQHQSLSGLHGIFYGNVWMRSRSLLGFVVRFWRCGLAALIATLERTTRESARSSALECVRALGVRKRDPSAKGFCEKKPDWAYLMFFASGLALGVIEIKFL